ncbi:MAG: N-acetylneuraminate synthase family protein [Oligoflexales bacterium]
MQKFFEIKDKKIGERAPCFIIAEIGNNHNGSLARAKLMVDECAKAGVDAVKFQLRNMDALYGGLHKTSKDAADLGTQYTLDLLEKYQLSNAEMYEIFQYCRERHILAFCTPWDLKSVEVLEDIGVQLYKIASADFTNHQLIERLARTRKPLICSTGMSTEAEVRAGIKLLNSLDIPYALLHCNSTYPAPFKDVNLRYLSRLIEMTPIVGYSGHERGYHVPIAAVALGAKIIEKHFTLDKSLEGVDHKVSLLPSELTNMVKCIREVEEAMSCEAPTRRLSQGEMMNRENLGKSLALTREVNVGEVITESDVTIVSPGQGLPPYFLSKIIGIKAKRSLKKGEVLFPSDLPDAQGAKPEAYRFRRPWGIPIRYHDTRKFLGIVRPDFIEFHMSYGDLDLDPYQYLDKQDNMGFTVHAPELFENDHILDLCSDDPKYLQKSLDNMKRTIDATLRLKELFPRTARPFVVATIGGFTTDRPLTPAERQPKYEKILQNLRTVEDSGVEILPQSTAPFPWHMGGQQYQNLFLYPEEIAEFCKANHYRITLDVSHSFLACNHLKIDPKYFYSTVAPYTAHLHLGDSSGVDGEGLQIGDGEMDFQMLAGVFDAYCPKAWFIPEIWQGHKNLGEGFWTALNRLSGIF